MSKGLIALVGGNEFRPESASIDRLLIEHLGTSQTKVAILPTAAANEHPELAGRNGVQHFRALRVAAETIMIVDQASANDPGLVEQLSGANFLYLAGGNPQHLLQALINSRAWRRISAMVGEGCVLAGSSAGAMVLCDAMYHGGLWQQALGMLPGICVVPHFAERPAGLLQDLQSLLTGKGLVALGIDGATACVGYGDEWLVAGRGAVRVMTPVRADTFTTGESFSLAPYRAGR